MKKLDAVAIGDKCWVSADNAFTLHQYIDNKSCPSCLGNRILWLVMETIDAGENSLPIVHKQ